MTTEPPGVGRNDPDAATNGTPGANGQRLANGQPPWQQAPLPAGMPTEIVHSGRNGRMLRGDLDEVPRGKPPDTDPLPAPVSLALPTAPSAQRAVHRARGRKPPSSASPLAPPLDDADGHDLRPDPLASTTPAELMKCARQFRIWAGNRGLRVMSLHIRHALSAQTLSILLRSDQLPRQMETMRLLIEACGGDVEYQKRFITAWRGFMMQ